MTIFRTEIVRSCFRFRPAGVQGFKGKGILSPYKSSPAYIECLQTLMFDEVRNRLTRNAPETRSFRLRDPFGEVNGVGQKFC